MFVQVYTPLCYDDTVASSANRGTWHRREYDTRLFLPVCVCVLVVNARVIRSKQDAVPPKAILLIYGPLVYCSNAVVATQDLAPLTEVPRHTQDLLRMPRGD